MEELWERLTVWPRSTLLEAMHFFTLADIDVLYRVNADKTDLRISIDCSDLFDWASADAEELLPSDLPDLYQAYEDLRAIKTAGPRYHFIYAGELWCARKRGMRPQGPWYGYTSNDAIRRQFLPEEVEALFDACGPDRGDKYARPPV